MTLTVFDTAYSQEVTLHTSYHRRDVVVGARFQPMVRTSFVNVPEDLAERVTEGMHNVQDRLQRATSKVAEALHLTPAEGSEEDRPSAVAVPVVTTASESASESEVESRWSALFYEHVAFPGAAARAEPPHARRRLAGGTIYVIRWHCPERQYSEMATLFQSGQEGLIKHLFERATASSDGDEGWEIRSPVLAVFLAFYFPLAAFAFGIAVPAGNFIPAMTVGAALGRLVGQELNGAEGAATSIVDAGKFAMLGSAAMLGGVTRMTLTLAVILVEVTKDVYAVVPIMITLACAKAVGDLFSPSFDHGMIHFNHLPFLEEEPPQEWEVLTARDVMAKHVIVLREIETVGDLVVLLRKTRHNGFPIVDTGRHGRCTFFNGLILRRQLLVVLSHRVWELQRDAPNAPLPLEIQRAFEVIPCLGQAPGQAFHLA